jgi:DNA-binding GntR family transcriptional regulator
VIGKGEFMSELLIGKQMPYYEQCYHSIKNMIFNGKFKPGERINETQLAKDFNVSKSPVREAIRILEKEGLLVVDNSKVLVYEPTLKDIKDIYFCRMALESFATRQTTEIALDSEIEQLEQILLDTEKAISENHDSHTIITLNSQFHSLIIEYTRNDRIKKQIEDLRGLIYYFRVLNFNGGNRATIILNQHQQIFHHIKNRNAEDASKEMGKHLQYDIDHLAEILASQQMK